LRRFTGRLGLLSDGIPVTKRDVMGGVALRREEMTPWRRQR
jgi:hypothetical protein